VDVYEWIEIGVEQGWVTEACATHDGIPSTHEEDIAWEDGDDPCQHVLRLWEEPRNTRTLVHNERLWALVFEQEEQITQLNRRLVDLMVESSRPSKVFEDDAVREADADLCRHPQYFRFGHLCTLCGSRVLTVS
jgi:hypothetical protein